MALKKSIIRQSKPQKPRITKSKVLSIDLQYSGTEPLQVTESNYTQALNWYNYNFDNDKAREWLLEYLKRNSAKDVLQAVRKASRWAIPTTIGWQARIMMNGNTLSELSMEFFNSRLTQIVELVRNTKRNDEEVVVKPVVSIQERVQAKIQQLLTDCEEAIDLDSNLNIYDWLKGKEATPMAATAIGDFYAKTIADLQFEDEYATRAEKKQNADRLKYWTQFVDDCQRYVGNKKVTKIRKPREKKTKSAVDLVSKLKFQKEFPQLKIVSVNPADVVGCRQLWTYNTKYRKLTRYDAVGPNGIQVKGASLVGFDVEKSCTKSLRKPDTIIPSLLGAGKIALRTFIEEIKTNETKPNGRINIDTILLRVIK